LVIVVIFLQTEDNKVVFKRLLSSKKDKFYVNGKELKNAKQFLETAGLCNPYFVVKQGKVHQLALASDSQRLELLQSITGSKLYDDKIKECKKNIDSKYMGFAGYFNSHNFLRKTVSGK